MKETAVWGIFRPGSLDQLLSIVQVAADGGMGVRVVGSSWSFAGTVKPDPGQFVVETKNLNAEIVSLTSRIPCESPYHGLLYHVEAGIKISDLYKRLAARGLALPTQGGSGGQSIAGVMATGTHGGDIDLPPIADAVRAMHVVGPDGQHYWIERASAPITSLELVEAALPFIDPSNIKYDDDWFDAILVSFGALAAIYSVVLQARPAFQLEEHTRIMPWEDVKTALLTGEIFNRVDGDGRLYRNNQGDTERTRFLEILMAPNSPSTGSRACYVTTRNEIEPAASVNQDFPPNDPGVLGILCRWNFQATIGGIIAALPLEIGAVIGTASLASTIGLAVPGADVLSATLGVGVATAAPILTAILSAELAALEANCTNLMKCASALGQALNRYGLLSMLRDVNGSLLAQGRAEGSKQGPSWWIMDTFDYSNPHCMEIDSLEAFFPADHRPALVENLQALLDGIDAGGTVLGYLSLRFTSATTALLGMQQGPEVNGGAKMTCSAELTIIKDLPANKLVMESAQRVTLRRGGRLHWGQRNEIMLDTEFRQTLLARYRSLDRWKRVRHELDSPSTLGSVPVDRFVTFDNAFIRTLLGISE